jgi:predicted alpha/beta superfamily hydrolase
LLVCAKSTSAADEQVIVTFKVTVPVTTPREAKIYVNGDAAPLVAWKEDGLELQKQDDGTFAAKVKLSRDMEVHFKVTRGTWRTVEKKGDGTEIENRSFTPKGDETVKFSVAAWADQFAAASVKSTKTGDIRVHEKFHSKHLDNDRRLLVWLPPGYEREKERRYPVLYMHDGQNVFDAATSFTRAEWEADETTTRLIAEGKIRPIIVVAIENNAARVNEYTLTRDEQFRGGVGAGGNGAAYLKFVAEEVKPFVDRTYRTKTEGADTAVAGSSLGGTISLELCRAYPQMFGACAALSPAAWWNHDELLNRYERDTAWMKETRFWIDIGTLEGDGPKHEEYVDGVRRLERILKNAGLTADRDYAVRIIEGGQHEERAWAKRFDQVLVFLFGQK